MTVQRHVFHADLGKEGGQRLLDWCRTHGADSFTFAVIGSPPDLERQAAAITAPLEPFRIARSRIRVVPEGQPGNFWTNVPVLWELNDATEAILLRFFPHGLLTYTPTNNVWCEDPCLFRGERLMLGITSHEGEGILRIEASEELALDRSEIPNRLDGEWVGG